MSAGVVIRILRRAGCDLGGQRPFEPPLDVEDKEAMRAAGFPFAVGLVPEWFSSGGDLQLHAVFEKGDDEADARIGEQVADGVKEAVAAEVWDAECAVVQNFDEARIAAAVGGVSTSAEFGHSAPGRKAA